ncbi:glycogen synthase GlgA [Mangrovitalea sediminis]|uniref:glycogen synthase GlgA n=1 Tax=Mangrovitalea sediminis TaxID=1982043 RepID=UPI000BE5DEB1|nr:glycogen synthase GlgA [Mangrovitalea sediminis]
MFKVLFVTSEAAPLMKTGGLGDVSASLPRALQSLGCKMRLLMPAYPETLERAKAGGITPVAETTVRGQVVRILQTRLPGTRLAVWLVECPALFGRAGNPYHDDQGNDWPDNAERFDLLCRVACEVALDRIGLNWQPDVVHCNDWQTGLVPVLLADEPKRPATLFTVHNLAYHGRFPYETLIKLGLPERLWDYRALEFHGYLSLLKGGLVFADRLTTVSPHYAEEIQGPDQGQGLDGLLRLRRNDLDGILNGIDDQLWDPAHDHHLPATYNLRTLPRKAVNKAQLQQEMGLEESAERPLIGFIGRLVEQKGIDLMLESLDAIMGMGAQFVMLGSGQPEYEKALKAAAGRYPGRMALRLGYDETLAHRIEAGADMFLMPSRFEPCGLNQLYSLRYGTVPIVHDVGGLHDTVVNTDPISLESGAATGFIFSPATPAALTEAVSRALDLYRAPADWQRLQAIGMTRDFSWQRSGRAYMALYADACKARTQAETNGT